MQKKTAVVRHDNDPERASEAAGAFLRKDGVKVMAWPSTCPELNPIEHLWGILKTPAEHRSPSSNQAPEAVVPEEWKKTDVAIRLQLLHSRPRRLAAVLKNHTKY